jgi:hypothetical protein
MKKMTVKEFKENEKRELQLLMDEIDTDEKLRGKIGEVIKKHDVHDRVTVVVDMGLSRLKTREVNRLKARVEKVLMAMADEGILQRNWLSWYTVIPARN